LKKNRQKLRKSGKIALLFITLAIFILSISAVSAAEVTVNSVSGDKISGGLSSALPGQTIELIGTFTGVNNVNISINKNITFTSNPSNRAIIDGGGTDFLFSNINGFNVRFENIIFQNAFNTASGGVIFSNGGTLTFINCTFKNNEAYLGGAIFTNSNCDIFIDNCTFDSNKATNDTIGHGGAICQANGSLIIKDTSFTNNLANSSGGAIFTFTGGDVFIDGCTFDSNNAADNGGAIVQNGGSLTISDSIFTYNVAGRFGGAIATVESDTKIKYSLFYSNQASTDANAINQDYTIISPLTYNQNLLTKKPLDNPDLPCIITGSGVNGAKEVVLTTNLPKGTYWVVIKDDSTIVFSDFVTFVSGKGAASLTSNFDSSKIYNVSAYKNSLLLDLYATGLILNTTSKNDSNVPTNPTNNTLIHPKQINDSNNNTASNVNDTNFNPKVLSGNGTDTGDNLGNDTGNDKNSTNVVMLKTGNPLVMVLLCLLNMLFLGFIPRKKN
jgi:predicted outer membrane repeat protein